MSRSSWRALGFALGLGLWVVAAAAAVDPALLAGLKARSIGPAGMSGRIAVVEAEKSALLRSDDGGRSFRTVNDDPDVAQSALRTTVRAARIELLAEELPGAEPLATEGGGADR